MATPFIDTYSIAKRLQAKGYSEQQAEGFIEAFQDISTDRLADKSDIAAVRQEIKGQGQELRQEMQELRQEMKDQGQEIRQEIQSLKTSILEVRYDILKWMIPLMFGIYGLVIFKLF